MYSAAFLITKYIVYPKQKSCNYDNTRLQTTSYAGASLGFDPGGTVGMAGGTFPFIVKFFIIGSTITMFNKYVTAGSR